MITTIDQKNCDSKLQFKRAINKCNSETQFKSVINKHDQQVQFKSAIKELQLRIVIQKCNQVMSP